MAEALIFVAAGSEEIEAITPGDVLVRAGVGVTYASVGAGTAGAGTGDPPLRGSRGLPLAADVRAEDLMDRLFDAVILPGGAKGAEGLAASGAVAAAVRAHAEAGRLIAAICAAPALVLAPLGVLDGKRATCYPGFEARFGPETTHAEGDVVEDGSLITSRGPGTAMAFALAVAARLAGEEIAAEVARAMLVRA